MRAVIGRRASRAFLMDWERLHEDLQRAVEELQERSRHAPVIVEGEYDRRSLRALGVVGDIRLVNEGSTIFALCESIASRHREAIILTDWDVRGGRLARQCRKDITDVESLHGFVERVEEHASLGNRQRPSKRWYADRVQRRDTRRRSQK